MAGAMRKQLLLCYIQVSHVEICKIAHTMYPHDRAQSFDVYDYIIQTEPCQMVTISNI